MLEVGNPITTTTSAVSPTTEVELLARISRQLELQEAYEKVKVKLLMELTEEIKEIRKEMKTWQH